MVFLTGARARVAAFEVVEAEVVERKTAGDHARRHLAQHRRIGRCQTLRPGRQVQENY